MRTYFSLFLVAVAALGGCSRCDRDECRNNKALKASIDIYDFIEPRNLSSVIPLQAARYVLVDTGYSSGAYYFILQGNHDHSRARFQGETNWFYGDTIFRYFNIGNAPWSTPNGRKYGNIVIQVEAWRDINACNALADTISFNKTFYFDEGPYYCDTTVANRAYGWGTYKGIDETGREKVLTIFTQDYEVNKQAQPCYPVHIMEGLVEGFPNLLRGTWSGLTLTYAKNIVLGITNRNRGLITCKGFFKDNREVVFFGWYDRRQNNVLHIDYKVYNFLFPGSIESKTFDGQRISTR
jgi:hypothetical protein